MSKRTKVIHVSDAVAKIVSALAVKRAFSPSEAAEHLIKVGHTRIETLAKHTAKRTKERRAVKKAKKKVAKVIPIATPPVEGEGGGGE